MPGLNPVLCSSPPQWRLAGRLRARARTGVAVLALVAFLAPQAALAQEQSSARKFGRGLAGLVVGFLEIPGNVVEESRENGALQGVTIGLGKGLGMFVTRTLVGVYELLSAPFEVPDGFEPILEPEFPWQYFDDDRTGDALASQIRAIPGVGVGWRGEAMLVTFPDGLLFSVGSSTLSPAARSNIAELAMILRGRPELEIHVRGHTDTTGSAATNLQLSTARARAVAEELKSLGLAPRRLSVEGVGGSEPVASNTTAAGRRSNRRVEIELR